MSLLFDNLKLDLRLQGASFGEAIANSVTEFEHIIDYNCKMNGFSSYAWNSNPGDFITFETQYNIGTIENPIWRRYKKFGKNYYVFPNAIQEVLTFPTEPRAGVRILIKYNNVGQNNVKLAINLFKFVDSQYVNVSQGEQGEDW